MPTFNQLVRKGRQTVEKKSTAPALQKRPTNTSSPQKRGVPLLRQQLLKNLTQLLERSPEFVYQTESK